MKRIFKKITTLCTIALGTMWCQWRLDIVGKALLQILHTKCFILLGTQSYQMLFQNFFWPLRFEPPALEEISQETNILWALLVVNIPVSMCAQIMRSSGRRVLNEIPKIMSASWGINICCIASVLHATLPGSIKELTFAFGAKEGRGDMTEQFARPGSHLSSLIRKASPCPYAPHHPFLNHISSTNYALTCVRPWTWLFCI